VEPAEISISARQCDGRRIHSVGDLLSYRSSLWMVKGLYVAKARSGDPELFYILSEISANGDKQAE
jgi:hypothetical protein